MARILIIDDTPAELDLLQQLLEQQGHEVFAIDNGADGIALCIDKLPDAVLVDAAMPEINGFQVTRQLTHNAKTGHIPIIIAFRSLQEADEVWAIKQGARSLLEKPVTQQKLLKILKNIFATETV